MKRKIVSEREETWWEAGLACIALVACIVGMFVLFGMLEAIIHC